MHASPLAACEQMSNALEADLSGIQISITKDVKLKGILNPSSAEHSFSGTIPPALLHQIPSISNVHNLRDVEALRILGTLTPEPTSATDERTSVLSAKETGSLTPRSNASEMSTARRDINSERFATTAMNTTTTPSIIPTVKNFRALSVLGRGDVGCVYLVQGYNLGERNGLYAMKVLNKVDILKRCKTQVISMSINYKILPISWNLLC